MDENMPKILNGNVLISMVQLNQDWCCHILQKHICNYLSLPYFQLTSVSEWRTWESCLHPQTSEQELGNQERNSSHWCQNDSNHTEIKQ